MNNLIKVTDNYSISEEHFIKMKNAMKEFFDAVTDCGLGPDMKDVKDTKNNEGAQALLIVLVNAFTEGAIESTKETSIKEYGKSLDEETEMLMRDQARNVLNQVIFNHV